MVSFYTGFNQRPFVGLGGFEETKHGRGHGVLRETDDLSINNRAIEFHYIVSREVAQCSVVRDVKNKGGGRCAAEPLNGLDGNPMVASGGIEGVPVGYFVTESGGAAALELEIAGIAVVKVILVNA